MLITKERTKRKCYCELNGKLPSDGTIATEKRTTKGQGWSERLYIMATDKPDKKEVKGTLLA